MSGHNKWSTIKHKKARQDAQRSRIWTKIIRELTTAARMGGGDPEGNPRLRLAIDAARAANMPKENIERAIKRGTGELEGTSYEELTLEGYGPGGVGLLIDVLTDNRNRTVAEVRHILGKHGGKMAESGAVAWVFQVRGAIRVPAEGIDEDDLMMAALDAGAEDVERVDDEFVVSTEFAQLDAVRRALEEAGIEVREARMVKEPSNTVPVTDEAVAQRVLKLLDALESNDDVQAVWANFDIDDTLIERLSA